MTWKQKTVSAILLLVARLINEDEWMTKELNTLSNHISAGDWLNYKEEVHAQDRKIV